MPDAFNEVTAAVLAGGLGTRLRSVVADRPKVLAPVSGRPFLAYLLAQLERAGVTETVLLIGFKGEQIQSAFGNQFGRMRLAYSQESEPLGTGGAIRLALPMLQRDTVLMMNGDSYCDLDLGAYLHYHNERPEASLALAQVENASRFGRVHLDANDRIARFEEKNPVASPGWINAGIYLFRRDLIGEIDANGPQSLERDVLPKWVASGRVRGFRGSGRFIDIGIPESYSDAEAFFAAIGKDLAT